MSSGSRMCERTYCAQGIPDTAATTSPATTKARFEYFQRASVESTDSCAVTAVRISSMLGKINSVQYGNGASRARPVVWVRMWRRVIGGASACDVGGVNQGRW